MTAPFDYIGLWDKAVLFFARATEKDRPFSERALWGSLGFELLAKAALAKINPALIADPVDDGKSLLIASGVGKDFSGFKSVPAKAVFSRCSRAFRPFNADVANRIAGDRNAELHSASLPYAIANEEKFWQAMWSQTSILVAALDKEMDDLVGTELLDEIEGHLARSAQANEHRVTALIERAKQRYEFMSSGVLSERVSTDLPGPTYFLQEYSGSVLCPACQQYGEITGDYAEEVEDLYDEDGFAIMELLHVQAENFACPHCHLTLSGSELLALAGVPETFEVEQEKTFEVDDYQNE